MNLEELLSRITLEVCGDALELRHHMMTNVEFFRKDYTLYEGVADHIYRSLKTHNQNKLNIQVAGEALPPDNLFIYPKIVRILMKKYALPMSTFRLISAAAPHPDNIALYAGHCANARAINTMMLPVPITFMNGWEGNARDLLLNTPDYYNKFDTTPRLKEKVFLSFNCQAKMHRVYLTAQIIDRGLLSRAFYSFYDNNVDMYLADWWPNIVQIPRSVEQTRRILQENINLLPLELNMRPGPCAHIDILDDFRYFNESYFSVVTENKFFSDIPGFDDCQLDLYLFSEKTYKPILAKHPFIQANRFGSLRVLRDFGYKTFHPWIDETYDTIVNDEDRLEAIADEIERLCKFTDDQWLAWQQNVRPIVEHNFAVLKNCANAELSN